MHLPDLSAHFRHTILAADFTDGGKNRSAVLSVSKIVPGVSRELVNTYPVTGKRHARTLAKSLGAQPWNF